MTCSILVHMTEDWPFHLCGLHLKAIANMTTITVSEAGGSLCPFARVLISSKHFPISSMFFWVFKLVIKEHACFP